MNKRENQIYDQAFEILKQKLNPSKIILFGSRAKENSEVSSDFDFAIECNAVDLAQKRNVQTAIDEVSGLYSVDVVYLDEVDDDFKVIIMKSGKVIYERGA